MTSSRALSLAAGLASPVFMVAAVAGWLTGRVPATPLTLGVTAFLVIAGPVVGLIHIWMVRHADDDFEEELEATQVLQPVTRMIPRFLTPELPLKPELAAARAFHRWREHPLPGIEERRRAEEKARRPYARL